jgi:hypothetical protein
LWATVTGQGAASFNIKGTDGVIADFYKDGTTVGSIGTVGGALVVGSGDTGLLFDSSGDYITPRNASTQAGRDAAINLGTSSDRFKDLYLSGGAQLGAGQNLSWGGAYGANIPTITAGSDFIAFYGSGSTSGESMRLSGGNLGIGITSPTQSLDTTGKIRIRDGGNTTIPSIQMGASGVDGLSLPDTNTVAFITNSSERMRIDSSGNITQTGSSSADFLIKAPTDNASLTLQAGASDTGAEGAFVNFLQNTTYKWQMGMNTDNSFRWYNYATSSEAMRIDSSGNLLVGKTVGNSPTFIGFEVQQDGEVYSSVATGYNTYHVYANSGYRFYVNPNGGLYNYSANNVNLSDEREKKNIELLESQWDSLKQWSLKKFHYNADDDSDNKKLGVIAQEVATHNPEVIDEFNVDDETTRMAVKEQQMMWIAIKALQEAQTRIETLEARVTQLENN